MLYITKEGLDLIKQFESFKGEAYLDPVGIPTIGWGTTKIYGRPVKLGMKVNELVGEALLIGDCKEALNTIERYVKITLKQNQIDALCSFVYNVGSGNFYSSSLLATINRKLEMTEDLWTRWNKRIIAGKKVVLNGLTKRRLKEYELYTR